MYIRLIYLKKASTFLTGKTHRAYKDFNIGVTKHVQLAEA